MEKVQVFYGVEVNDMVKWEWNVEVLPKLFTSKEALIQEMLSLGCELNRDNELIVYADNIVDDLDLSRPLKSAVGYGGVEFEPAKANIKVMYTSM